MFLKKYTINDLRRRAAIAPVDSFEARKKIRIAVIDNDHFQQLENLLNNGYDVSFLNATTNTKALREYHIIVCDINGVATEMNPEEEGAALIGEIKRLFPEKQVIVFSGNPGNSRKLRLARERADDYIPRAASEEVWFSILDDSISRIIDPCQQWNDARKRLESIGMPLLELTKLEHVFVKAVIKGEKAPLTKLSKKSGISESTRSTAISLASSAFWALIA